MAERNVRKDRECKGCGRILEATAKEMRRHAEGHGCNEAKPMLVKPTLEEVRALG